jgi:hypothetical protein
VEDLKLTSASLYSKVRYMHAKDVGVTTNRTTDCHNFVLRLMSDSQSDVGSFAKYVVHLETNEFKVGFFASSWMVKVASVFTNLVVFDTTHCTNYQNLYVGIFCVEDSYGETVITGWCFMSSQDQDQFEISLRASRFLEIFSKNLFLRKRQEKNYYTKEFNQLKIFFL